MNDSLAEHRARRQAAAVAALGRGQAALDDNRLDEAEHWLDRARRVAGGNDMVELLLATVRLRRGDADASARLFAALTARLDRRELWLGLAAAAYRAGQTDRAVAALARGLGQHVGAVDPGLRALADAICAESGAAGWCTLAPDGSRLHGTAAPEWRLDGRGVPAGSSWRSMAGLSLEARLSGRGCVGSPIDLVRLRRIEGFVEEEAGGLVGWAWHPADPDTAPALRITAPGGGSLSVVAETGWRGQDMPALARWRRFSLARAALPGPGLLTVAGLDKRALTGSPLDPGASAGFSVAASQAVAALFPAGRTRRSMPEAAGLAAAPVPVGAVGAHSPAAAGPARPIAVVVPVYAGLRTTLDCLASVFAHTPSGVAVIVVDDATPEPELAAALDRLAAEGRIALWRHATNQGFPAAANAGLRAAGRADVVLLNADTLVPPGWLDRLRAAAYAAADIGTATPLSNDATLLSYPRQEGGNPVPDLAETMALARQALRANRGQRVEIPTAVGFCMFIRRDCLQQVGGLREDVFAQGYGEENDFCLRARRLGWRHVAAVDAFVGHVGGASFGPARQWLLTRNLALLNALHPGYDALIAADESGPGLAGARRRLDLARVQDRRRRRGAAQAVLIVTHDLGGGVQLQVEARCAALREAGERPILLRPLMLRPLRKGAGRCVVEDGGETPNIVFDVPGELAALARHLAPERPRLIELHHMLGHDHALMQLPALLGVPYEIHVHDYAWFCPRVTLVGFERRYCGEPDIAGCEACIADAGRNIDEEIGVAALIARSAADLAGAVRVIAPSSDTALRMTRHFPGLAPLVRDWDRVRLAAVRPSARAGRVVAVLGAIGIEKGYDVLLACARDAARRRLPLRFVVIGHSIDDARLIETGAVFVTGEYTLGELPGLIAEHGAALAFLPSIWPETWCFTLSEAWRAGLAVVAFDIGAPAGRIRAHGGGALLPLGCGAGQINAALVNFVPIAAGKTV